MPGSGYTLCAYKNRLKTRADAWLWGPAACSAPKAAFAVRMTKRRA